MQVMEESHRQAEDREQCRYCLGLHLIGNEGKVRLFWSVFVFKAL